MTARATVDAQDGQLPAPDMNNLQQGDAHLLLQAAVAVPRPAPLAGTRPQSAISCLQLTRTCCRPQQTGRGGEPLDSLRHRLTEDSQSSSSDTNGDSSSDDNPQPPPIGWCASCASTPAQVLLVQPAFAATSTLPINSEGYLESLRGRAEEWVLNLNFFTGGSRVSGQHRLRRAPTNEFISQQEVLVTACDASGGHKLIAITTGGKILWSDLNRETAIWPILTPLAQRPAAHAGDARRHPPHQRFRALGSDDIKGQLVRVFDAATGEVAFEAPASPIFDDGGNTAISPRAQRVAVLKWRPQSRSSNSPRRPFAGCIRKTSCPLVSCL